METYTYFAKAAFNCEAELQVLRGKRAVLLISVGQSYHEGDKLAATIDVLGKSDLESCTIAVADTLQRHNNMHLDSQCARLRAYEAGTQWLRRNEAILRGLTTPASILRWDEICADQALCGWTSIVEHTYSQERSYRDAIDHTIDVFVQRAIKRCDGANLKVLKRRCLDYLLEECPIIMPMWASQGYDFIIYPQPMTSAMRATRNRFVTDRFPGKAQWLSLRFKRRTVEAHLAIKSDTAIARSLNAQFGH